MAGAGVGEDTEAPVREANPENPSSAISEDSDAEEEEEDEDEEEKEGAARWWEAHRWLINFAVVVFYILVGVLAIHRLEKWGPVTSLYLITQIVTTIGYGDVTVTEAVSEWFMILYVIVGIMIVANILNDYLEWSFMSTATTALRARLRRLEARLMKNIPDTEAAKERCGVNNALLVSVFLYLLFVFGGAIFFTLWESCSCSYGATRIQGCVRENCSSTGGASKSFREALYMAVITLSTTGFGDYAPKTRGGRIFSLFWMNFGVLAWVHLLTQTGLWWRELKKAHRVRRLTIRMEDFRRIDENHDGRVSRAEFRVYFMLKEGIVQKEDLKHIDMFFDRIDKDCNGTLSVQEMDLAMKLHRNDYEY